MSNKIIPDFDKKLKPTKNQLLILENIRKCKNVTDYIKLRLNKDSTKRCFATYIRNYFVHLNISSIDSYFKDPRRMTNSRRIDYLDNIEHDIESFNDSLKSNSGSYRLSSLSAIRKLLEYNRIDLGNNVWEGIRKAGSNAERETDIITPTREQLKNILSRADNEGKAFFLMQMTSGSRIDEIRTLTFDNLGLEKDPPSFRISKEHSKTGRAITKFISYEAKHYLNEYLKKDRDRILATRTNRARLKEVKKNYQNMVFPMGKSNPELIWNNLCKKEGLYKLDQNTKHPIMGTHSLRRFFEDNIGHGKLSKYMLNKLTKSEEPYSFKTKHKLEGLYKKYMDNLCIFDTPKKTKEEIIELRGDLAEKEDEIKRLKEGMEIIDKGRKSFEDRFKDYDDKFKNIEHNLNISLNPKTPETQNVISYFEGLIPNFFKLKYGREPTKEEIMILIKQYKEEAPEILKILREKTTDEILEIAQPKNFLNIYPQLKPKDKIKKTKK